VSRLRERQRAAKAMCDNENAFSHLRDAKIRSVDFE
jgi:hypothetical protein